MALDPRSPVIVGVGQTLRRPSTVDELVEPLDLMVEALERAADDAGPGRALLESATSVRVVEALGWRTPNPGAAVAERLKISPAESVQSATGGNSPQMLVNHTAAAIQRGDLDVALITGAEAMYSRRQARKLETRVPMTAQPEGTPPATVVGLDKAGNSPAELARQMGVPIQMYPLFENAIRAAAGRSIAEHQMHIAGLWSRFSEVAATNPYAWTREAKPASEIATPSDDNRMVGFPYTKWMNANMQTDQGAAIIMCSVEAAQAAGIDSDRWVFPLGGADAHDHWFVSERHNLHSSPAIAACGRAALGLAGVGIDDIAHVDLYSCFPSAVQIGAAALGLSIDRQLTLTGGLTFGGGPGNNYVTHSIAALVERLRSDPGSLGLVNANGWYVTKHAVGVYGTAPPAEGFRAEDVQAEVDAGHRREVAVDYEGEATLETYTVMHERDGSPQIGILLALLDDGRRAIANTFDADLMLALTTEDLIGRRLTVKADGTADLA